MKEQILLAVVISFAAGVLVTGIAYDMRDLDAASARKSAVEAPAPDSHVRELICAHRVTTGQSPGSGCV